MTEHIAAAEHALRERARSASGKEKARAKRHAEVLAQIQREFRERPLSEGAIARPELVDALLDGTDALRLKADGERQAAARAPEDSPQHTEREDRACEYERQADAILELDRDL